MARVAEWLLSLPQRFPRATLCLAGAVTIWLGAWAAHFRVDSAVDQLLPINDPDTEYYDGVRRVFGSEEIAVIGIFAADVFAPETLTRIDRLTRELARLPGVQEVVSLASLARVQFGDQGLSRERLMPALPLTTAATEEFRRQTLAYRLAERAIVSADSRASGIWVRFAPMTDQEFLARDLEGRMRAILAAVPGPEAVALTGLPTIKVQAAREMVEDLALFAPLALLLVIAVLIWAFRTWRGLLLPLASVVMGVVWTTGVMVAVGDAFTMGSLVLPPLLMALGTAYAIHVVSRYYLAVQHHPDNAAAVAAAIEHVRVPVAMAALTTMVGFGTFVTSPIPSVRDFGVYAALGIVFIFSACIAVIPATLVLLPAPRTIPSGLAEGGWFARFVAGCGELSIRYRWLFLALFAALLAGGAWGVTRIRVETDYLRFFSPSNPVRVENARIGDALAGTQVVTVVIDGDGPESVTRAATLEAVRDLQRFIERQERVDKTMSVLDHLDSIRRVLVPERAAAPFTDQNEVDQLLLLIAPHDVRHELNADRSRLTITAQTRLSGSQEVGGFVAQVERYGAAHLPADVRVHATGTVVLLDRSADALAWSQVTGDAQVLLILLLLMSLLMRSLRLGLLSMVPNVVPIALLLGIMGWAGVDLNICTSTIASISIGIAVDDTIHYMLGFHAALRAGAGREEAILSTLRGVGRPILIAAIALCAGFLIVCLSNFQPVRHFGLLCSITMVIAVFTELFLLPALLVTLRVGRVAVRAPLSAVGGGEGAAPAALLARQRSAAAEE
jgi:predicted RND superfamily exporter protein